jgi:hypothetical protein
MSTVYTYARDHRVIYRGLPERLGRVEIGKPGARNI